MIPQEDEFPERPQRTISRYLTEGSDAALEELAPISYPIREVQKRAGVSNATKVAVFRRDAWLCRYCGGRTIFTPVMALLAKLFPEDFPYHPNWKSGYTHPAIAARSAAVDHIHPGSWGGSWNALENLATACWPCNMRKGDLTLEQLGWIIRPVPEDTGWHGLTEYFSPLWHASGRPRELELWLTILGDVPTSL